jgi:hypothetical protein
MRGRAHDRIWQVFAHRGMGYFAAALSGDDTRPDEDSPCCRARTPRWSPSPTVRLPAAVDIGGLLIDPTAGCGDDTTASLGDYRIDTSADGTTWATAAEGRFGPADTGRENAVALRAGTGENVRYVRLTLLGNRAADYGVDCAKDSGPSGCRYLGVTELVVHGAPTGADGHGITRHTSEGGVPATGRRPRPLDDGTQPGPMGLPGPDRLHGLDGLV